MTTPRPSAADPPSQPESLDKEDVRSRRIGLVLFAVYVAIYVGFVGLSAFRPQDMVRPVWQGVNLAILYGLGLIGAAIILAVAYMIACRGGNQPAQASHSSAQGKQAASKENVR